jgi:hypothetical protein
MSIQNSKIILSTWGYPTVSYGGGEQAKVLYTPDRFDEFREIMVNIFVLLTFKLMSCSYCIKLFLNPVNATV